MSTENNKDFQWTDEAAKAFAKFAKKRSEEFHIELWDNEVLSMFKQHWEKRRTAYEILSFHDLLNRSKVSHNKLQVQYYLERPNSYKIHSVRRTTDGEVFELGDEVEWSYCKGPHKIAEFDFPPERIPFVHGKEPCGFSFPFFEMKKVINLPTPKPLFTTEDGVDTYEGQDCWVVEKGNEGGWNLHYWEKACKKALVDGEKYFHFYSNAEAWVEAQKPKPLFRTEDGVDIYEETNNVYGVNTKTWEKRTLSLIVVPSLNGYKWFAVEYNRDRYILMNKPALSINDVMFFFEATTDADTFLGAITEKVKEKL
jgi:hypothetical protein